MKSGLFLLLFLLLGSATAVAQTFPNYTVYWTGDTTDAPGARPQGGVCLMGGATEHDSASAWFVRRAGGGDIIVLRASGADGYNDYFYNGLPGARPHSVLTIVCQNRQASADPWLLRQVRRAEGVWFAGGDQADYVNYWKNTPLHATLQYLLDSTQAVFGGTSAGCAILGNAYYSGLTGSVTSAQALANPFDPLVTLGANDFLKHRELGRMITDTHFEARNRQGRLTAFLARLTARAPGLITADTLPKAIGIEEYTAVCIDTAGLARVFGDGTLAPNPDVAWFVAPVCVAGQGPEVLQAGQPLTWNRGGTAFSVYRVLGTPTGTNTFNLRTYGTGTGGTWEHWAVQAGQLQLGLPGAAPFVDCRLTTPTALIEETGECVCRAVTVEGRELVSRRPEPADVALVSLLGRIVFQQRLQPGQRVPLPAVASGIYVVRTVGAPSRRVLVD